MELSNPSGESGLGGGSCIFYVAKSGRPGPVVLDFAKNAQVDKTEYVPTKVDYIRSYLPVPEMNSEAIRQAAEC